MGVQLLLFFLPVHALRRQYSATVFCIVLTALHLRAQTTCCCRKWFLCSGPTRCHVRLRAGQFLVFPEAVRLVTRCKHNGLLTRRRVVVESGSYVLPRPGAM